MSIKAFMQPPVEAETKKVIISARFTDENGEPQPFVIRVISQETNESLRRQAGKPIKKNGVVIGEDFDPIKYGRLLINACTVSPNFKDRELCEYYKTLDPLDVPGRMLTAGEYAKLVREINDLNGFTVKDEDMDELEEEAKN